MNPYYSGLGIARSLRGCGVRVYGLASESDAPGARSRHFQKIYEVPNGRDEPERLHQRLLEIRSSYSQRPVLFPTRDLDVVFLHDYRDSLADAYLLPQPQHSPILRMMDKAELAAVASAEGIPTPNTVLCGSSEDLARHVTALQFPVVVKPRFAYQWRRKGLWKRLGAAKAILIHSPEELRACYQRLANDSPEVLLQEYVVGGDTDIVVCGCYVNRNGVLLGHFTGRKVKQSPPLVGTGCIVEAAEVPDLGPLSLRLLRAFHYAGLAEIEFKFDKRSGRFFLIEINPRHWDQHELGTLVGVNLSWIAYRDMVGLPVAPSVPAYPGGASYKWIAERELIEGTARKLMRELAATRGRKARVASSLKALASALRELGSLLKYRKICGLMRLEDPLPGIFMWLGLLRDAMRFFAFLGYRQLDRRSEQRATIEDQKTL
jgi:predicted ATP-grasp superfamily ATP-dependent carboligase